MSARTDAILQRGAKHACANIACGRRFYDLNKLPTPCPYCGVLFSEIKVVAAPVIGRRPGRYETYKLQRREEPAEEPLPNAEVPVPEASEEEVSEPGADEILEIEEDDDDTLNTRVADQGDA